MTQYRVTVPYVDDMGSVAPFIASSTPMETKEENALWTINAMRNHDSLSKLARLPAGTRFDRLY